MSLDPSQRVCLRERPRAGSGSARFLLFCEALGRLLRCRERAIGQFVFRTVTRRRRRRREGPARVLDRSGPLVKNSCRLMSVDIRH